MIFTPTNKYSAVLDACVLAPAVVCDTLLRLAEEPAMFRPLWSPHIMTEMARVLETKFHRSARDIGYKQTEMNQAFPEAMITVPRALAGALDSIPEEAARTVLGAAILGHADVIVTQNTEHFPKPSIEPYGVLCQSAEDFLIDQFRLSEQMVLDKLDDQAAGITRDRSYVLEGLRRAAPGFVECIEEYIL